jgi:hypothetical protein
LIRSDGKKKTLTALPAAVTAGQGGNNSAFFSADAAGTQTLKSSSGTEGAAQSQHTCSTLATPTATTIQPPINTNTMDVVDCDQHRHKHKRSKHSQPSQDPPSTDPLPPWHHPENHFEASADLDTIDVSHNRDPKHIEFSQPSQDQDQDNPLSDLNLGIFFEKCDDELGELGVPFKVVVGSSRKGDKITFVVDPEDEEEDEATIEVVLPSDHKQQDVVVQVVVAKIGSKDRMKPACFRIYTDGRHRRPDVFTGSAIDPCQTYVARYTVAIRNGEGEVRVLACLRKTLQFHDDTDGPVDVCHGGCGFRTYGTHQFCDSTPGSGCSSPGSGELCVVGHDGQVIGHYNHDSNKFFEGNRAMRNLAPAEPLVSLDGTVAVRLSRESAITFSMPTQSPDSWRGGRVTVLPL